MKDLTPEEIEVLQLIAEGFTRKEIGKMSYMALDTVKLHLSCAVKKLSVPNKSAAVYKAYKLGIIE